MSGMKDEIKAGIEAEEDKKFLKEVKRIADALEKIIEEEENKEGKSESKSNKLSSTPDGKMIKYG